MACSVSLFYNSKKSLFYKNVQAIRKIVLVLGTLYQIEFVLLLEESY